MVVVFREMESNSSWIWTCVTVSISYDENLYHLILEQG